MNAKERRAKQIQMGTRGEPDDRPISEIRLFTGYRDNGPSDGGHPSAFCPHCGSGGRYVYSFMCADDTRRGAMKGCIKLFPVGRVASVQLASLERYKKDLAAYERNERRYPPASWDEAIYTATELFACGSIDAKEAEEKILLAERRRQQYLSRFKRVGGRR